MIRIRLFDEDPGPKYVDFVKIPVWSEGDFQCQPQGLISLDSAEVVGKELDEGFMSRRIYSYQWFRQARAE
jgi:hypothetical protein